jgi:hypothetical protein
MSILFETLQRLEGERRGFNSPPLQETEELLRCAEEKLASKIEAASARQKNEGHLNGQPIQASATAPALVQSASFAPAPAPVAYAAEPAPVFAPAPVPVPVAAPAFAPVHVAAQPTLTAATPVPVPVAAAPTLTAATSVPAAAAPTPTAAPVPAVAAPAHGASRPAPVSTALDSLALRPTRMHRTANVIRAALPVVEALVAALDKSGGAPMSSALIPLPEVPAVLLPQPVDLAPIDEKLGEIKTLHIELRDQIALQNASVNQISDHLEGVRQSTDRNTRRQQELIEELRSVGKKVNFIAVTALGMTAVCVALNVLLVLHVFKIIP